jgi:hypothetical protein
MRILVATHREPSQEIPAAAVEAHADLIVMGRRGLGKIQRGAPTLGPKGPGPLALSIVPNGTDAMRLSALS